MEIQLDDAFKKALDLLENSKKNIFLTGNAGTGKSTLLSYFLKKTDLQVVVLAPTGVAALNIGGETVHSFFRFRPNITLEKAQEQAKKIKNKALFQQIDMIIIDEISMVRADLLDCIDVFLKEVLKNHKPFGGLRMVFIGDLYQLAPVLRSEDKEFFEQLYDSPYFFSSLVMKEGHFAFEFIELEKIYRQHDNAFIELLNAIRKKTITDEQIELLNQRQTNEQLSDTGYIYVTSTNRSAEGINATKLEELSSKSYAFEADTEGDFENKNAPTDPQLQLKAGAQVMCLINHPDGFWVNGTIGKIVSISDHAIQVEIEGEVFPIERYKWTLYKYVFDSKTNRLHQEEVGSFKQYPLKLAWAITIHKSQGKTYDHVVIDLRAGIFAPGQAYVALSRCRTLEGIFLKGAFKKNHVMMDYKVVHFLTKLQYARSEKTLSKEDKTAVIQKAIEEGTKLLITYLKANDQKSTRTIQPSYVGEMEYKDTTYLGVEAFCMTRNETRVFRVDRILAIAAHP